MEQSIINHSTDQYNLKKRFEKEVSAYFKELTFSGNTHTYYINNNKVDRSVSGKIKRYVEVVDWDAKAKAKDIRLGMPIGTHKAMWKAKADLACANGSAAHDYGENFHTDPTLEADTPKKKAILAYWQDLEKGYPGRYVLMGQEIRMYHKLYLWAGTCDFVLFDRLTRTFIIGDYKTNEDLFKNFREKTMLSPFDFLLDCAYNHYQLQLSYYQILLEQIKDIVVSDRQIIYLLPTGKYKIYNTFDYSKILLEQENVK